MKKLSFFLMAMLFSVMSFAAETVAYTLTTTATGSNSAPHNSYSEAAEGTFDGIIWNVTGNSSMVPWRIGGKNITAQNRAVYTKTAMAADITKIEITHATVNITCNSCTLTISDAANGAGETFPVEVAENTTTTITLPEGDYSNKFYKLVYNVTNTTNTNKYVQLSEIKFYTEVQTSVEAPTFTPEEGKVAANNTFAEPFALTIASATTDATIKYTLDGTDPTLETALTYEAPITISTMVQVRAIAVKGEEKSVEASVAYIISSSEAKPYTASEAIAAEALGLTGTVYVTGTVKSIEELSTQYGNATYNITDGTKELKIYRGKNLENAKFTSADQLLVGDVVVVKGDLTSYNGAAQLGQNNYLISRSTPVVNHTVTVSANPAEAGTVTGGGEYEETDEITVKAVANEGYEFVNWTEGETVVSTEANYSFEVLADRALVANFIKKTISYELNGGELPAVVVPTNEELALAFKQEYAEYFAIEGLTDTDMKREVGNFIYVTNSKGGDAVKFITENANWKWLHDYILTVAGNIPEGTNVGFYWRANLDGFFHCKNAVAVGGVASADYTEAGKPEAWGAAYQAAHAVVLPTEPVDAPYTLPTPVKEGYKFVGWYDNAEGTGEPMTVIPAGWDGTLYAIWVEIYTITVEAENGTVEGAGNYEHGAEATLTATPAEGYEFVNWTVGEDVVAETAEYTFTVTADVALVANFEVALPGTVALSCTGMNKMYMAMRDMLQLEGTSADDESVVVSLYDYAATVGDYQAFIAFGDLELETESLKITRGSDEWTLAATIDTDTAIYEFTATTAAPKTETIAPHAATWGGDAMNGYIIDCTTTSGTVQIGLMDGTEYGMGWMLTMAINDAQVVEGATIEAPTWEEDNLVLDVTVVSSTLDEYTIQLTATPKPAIEVIANATMALSEDEYEVGTMIVSATWNEHPLTVKLNGWPYYGYGEYAEANLVIEIDPENYDVVDAYSTATLEKKEDVAVLTGTFSHWDGNKYALTLTIAEPAAAPVVETVNVVCTDMVQGEEWGTPVLTGTCDLGDINISLNLEDTDHPESVYGEYGFAEYPMGLFPAVEVTIEGEDSFIMLELMENTVAVYTDGETQDSFVGTFLGSDWKVYVLDMKTPAPENPSALDNVTTTVAPIKMIENGQLMIIKNGVQYNAQGAVIK